MIQFLKKVIVGVVDIQPLLFSHVERMNKSKMLFNFDFVDDFYESELSEFLLLGLFVLQLVPETRAEAFVFVVVGFVKVLYR